MPSKMEKSQCFQQRKTDKKVIPKTCKSNGGLIKCSWLRGGSSSLGPISLRLKITAELIFDKRNQLHRSKVMSCKQGFPLKKMQLYWFPKSVKFRAKHMVST